MAEERDHEGREKMRKAIDIREARRHRWQTDGERSLWQNLSIIGALGWLIIVPTLIGVAAGRWLDQKFDTGVFFSGACIFLGVCFGGYLAWKRMNET